MNTKRKTGIGIALAVLMVFAMAALATADYSGDHPLTTYEHGFVDGKVMFATVEDGSAYTKLYATVPGNLTQEITINIPNSGEIKMARLYNYYGWSKSDYGDKYTPGDPAEAVLSLTNVDTGATLTETCVNPKKHPKHFYPNPIYYKNIDVIQYWDSKGQGYFPPGETKYDFPYGTFAWDVTDLVTTGPGTYIAKIENADSSPTGGEYFVTYGFSLLVVWERPDSESGSETTEYWINEGHDVLMARTYETPENATTSALFADRTLPIVTKAKLTTVVMCSDGGNEKPPLNMVSFNGVEIGPSTAANTRAIGVNTFNVIDYLQPDRYSSNIAEFQDRNDCEYVSNAFLVIKYSE